MRQMQRHNCQLHINTLNRKNEIEKETFLHLENYMFHYRFDHLVETLRIELQKW